MIVITIVTMNVVKETSTDHRAMIEEMETVIMQVNQDRRETTTQTTVIDQIMAIIKVLIRATIIIKMLIGALKITNAVREEMKDRTINSSLRKKTRALQQMHQ